MAISDNKELQQMYKELDEKKENLYKFFYTNPPQGVPILEKEQLFELGSLSPLFYYNPIITAMNLNEDKLLNEAEYSTYPLRTTVKYASDTLNIPLSLFKIINAHNCTKFIKVVLPNKSKKDKENLDKAMHLCGYYNASTKKYNGDDRFLELIYEPKYIDEANNTVRKNNMLYHLSPLPYKNKILKNGFVPKSNNAKFTYPDRNYFFLGSVGKQAVKEWMPTFKFNNKKYKKFPYCLYTIDVHKITENTTFYLDPNLKGGCYTYDNISPNTIILVEEFE